MRDLSRAGRAVGLLLGAAALVLVAGCAGPAQGASTTGGPSGTVGATVSNPAATSGSATGAAGPAGQVVQEASAADVAGSGSGSGDLSAPFVCPEPTVTVLDAADLKKALASAKPGDVIQLEHASYLGRFTITRSGTAARPIYLCGPNDAVLDSRNQKSGYTLHLDGASNWRLQGFAVRSGQKGVMVDAGHGVALQGLRVTETGDEAVHLRKNSTDNVVRGLTIRKTGLLHPKFGEGIYIGSAQSNWCDVTGCKPDRSDRNLVLENSITLTTAEAVDIKEGTSSGTLSGNTFDGTGMVAAGGDSWVDVKGNGWTITRNKGQKSVKDGFQVHVILAGWGDKNVFTRNTAKLSSGGTGILLQKPLANVVSCDNVVTGTNTPFSVACKN